MLPHFEKCWSLILLFLIFIIEIFASKLQKSNGNLGALWNLNQMAECKLGYSALAYNDYGCWCGVGGSGTPMDGIDTCCMYHDKCYDKAIADGACFDVPFEYVDDYSWNCNLKEPNCTEPQDPCKAYLCWCDKTVVDCWGDYPPPQAKSACIHHVYHVNPVQKKKSFFEEACDYIIGVAQTLLHLPSKIIEFLG